MKILVADDEPEILSLYSETLEDTGHKVTTASNGREALDRFTADDYDLVLMDLSMPTMDGFECIAEMQKQGQNVPVIVMTGYYPDDFVAGRLQEMAVKVIDTLRKPIRMAILLDAVNRLCPEGS